jgi:hypothetical protein
MVSGAPPVARRPHGPTGRHPRIPTR